MRIGRLYALTWMHNAEDILFMSFSNAIVKKSSTRMFAYRPRPIWPFLELGGVKMWGHGQVGMQCKEVRDTVKAGALVVWA